MSWCSWEAVMSLGLMLPHCPQKWFTFSMAVGTNRFHQHSPSVTLMLGPRKGSGGESSLWTMALLNCFEANRGGIYV